MIVYVETNFVLERALLRDEHESCERLLALARAGTVRLLLPAFSVGEPYEGVTRRGRRSADLSRRLADELDELSRSEPYARSARDSREVVTLLSVSNVEEKVRVDQTLLALLEVAELIPVDAAVARAAIRVQEEIGLSPQDSIVYASIHSHLSRAGPGDKCFITSNANDFHTPEVRRQLASHGCKLLTRFKDGLGFVGSR